MKEHWGYIDPSKNPDLDHIAASYRNAIFVVAFRDDELVGTGALVAEEEGVGRVVRMTVARHFRRLGIGTMILRYLCEQAMVLGYTRVVLETTSSWTDAIDFYTAAGFKFTHRSEGDTHFVLELDRPVPDHH
jgi:ribosomal protein S18 acetylase RimI-like enzyme